MTHGWNSEEPATNVNLHFQDEESVQREEVCFSFERGY